MAPKFIRRIEDFECEHCGKQVKGNGYTNHCPYCLWSKHVDINPGDRAETCGGKLEPIAIEGGTEFVILYRCQKCKQQRRNKSAREDAADVLVAIAAKRAARS